MDALQHIELMWYLVCSGFKASGPRLKRLCSAQLAKYVLVLFLTDISVS